MLCLSLAPGEYVTIGSDVVLQFDRMSGERCKLLVQAPREVPILRGEVLERMGGQRPGCVFEADRWRKSELPWNRSKAQALAAMRVLLSKMDGRDDDVKALRRQLNHMFPPEQSAETESGQEDRPKPSEADLAGSGETAKGTGSPACFNEVSTD